MTAQPHPRYRHITRPARVDRAIGVLIVVLAAAVIGLAGGMVFAHGWLTGHAVEVFATIVVAALCSFGWLFHTAAQSVARIPVHEIRDRPPPRAARLPRGELIARSDR